MAIVSVRTIEKGDETMSPKKATVCVVAAGSMWGTISIFVRHLDGIGLSAMQICFVRTLVALVVLFFALLLFRRDLLRISIKDVPIFICTGVFSYALFGTSYFMSVATGEVAVAAVLLYTSPIFVMIFSVLLFHEPLTKWKIMALLSTCTGCVFVSGILWGTISVPLFAIVTGLAAGFFYSTYSVFGHYALQKHHPVTIAFYTFAFAVLALLPFSEPTTLVQALLASPQSLWHVVGIALVCTVFPYGLYTLGLKHMETSKAAILATAEPLVGASMGILIFGEALTIVKFVGMVLIVSSIFLLNHR